MHRPPSLRSLSGAPATVALDAQATAFIVIDFQLEYFAGPVPGKLPIPDGLAAMAQAKRLIAFADSHRMPVFHIQHIGRAGGALFAPDGVHSAIHPDIRPAAHHVLLQKNSTSSFVGTDLHRQLQARGIGQLIVCGLMTHNCVSSTVRDARPLGYRTIVAGDACATRAVAAWDGGVLAHDDLHRAALSGVADGFAEVLPSARIMALDLQ